MPRRTLARIVTSWRTVAGLNVLLRKSHSPQPRHKLLDWRPVTEKDREEDPQLENVVKIEIWRRGFGEPPLRIEKLEDGSTRESVADEFLVILPENEKRRLPRKLAKAKRAYECHGVFLYRRKSLLGFLPWSPRLIDWQPLVIKKAERRLERKYGLDAQVERNFELGASSHDPLRAEQWGHASTRVKEAKEEVRKALEMVRQTVTGETTTAPKEIKVRIAVVDSGVDFRHKDLEIDETLGAVFRSRRHKCIMLDRSIMDEAHSHGTACTGLIAALTKNLEGIEGVALKAEILTAKFLGRTATGTAFDACRAIRWSVTEKARVILLAWGGGFDSTAVRRAIEHAEQENVVVVAAAGNRDENLDERPFFPASHRIENMIVTGGVRRSKHGEGNYREYKVSGSSYGTSVDLGAPGIQCKTTRRSHSGVRDGLSSRYGYFSGTSAAAAYVAGACSLVWLKLKSELHRNQDPCYQDVIQAILDGACEVPDLQFKNHRRLDTFEAVKRASNRCRDSVDREVRPYGRCPGGREHEEIHHGAPRRSS